MPDDGEDAGKCPLLEWCEMRDGQFRSIRDPLPKGRRGLRNVRLSLDSGRLAKIAACPRWARTGLWYRGNGSVFDNLVGANERRRRYHDAEQFAFWTLMASWNLLGGCTGKSAGFSPVSGRRRWRSAPGGCRPGTVR
jgi:hypothetical protein